MSEAPTLANKKRDDKDEAVICLNCTLPDCRENDDRCQLFHREGDDMSENFKDQATMRATAKQRLDRKDEIIQIYEVMKGCTLKTIARKLDMPESSLRQYLIRWGIYEPRGRGAHHSLEYAPKAAEYIQQNYKDDQINEKIDQNVDRVENTIPLYIFFEEALEQNTILEARAFWAGVKAAKRL